VVLEYQALLCRDILEVVAHKLHRNIRWAVVVAVQVALGEIQLLLHLVLPEMAV
jgi:hypothetical protein